MVNNKFPTTLQIRKELGNGIYKSITRFGGICEVAKRMGYQQSHLLITSDGHHVRSSYEYLLDEFLHVNKITHEVGGLIDSKHKYRYDFKIGNTYVEIWGFSKNKNNNRCTEYAKRRNKKEQLYKNLGIKLVSIEASIFHQPNNKINQFLQSLLPLFECSNLSSFDINNYIHHVSYWTEDTVKKELSALIQKLDHFPNIKEIQQHNNLSCYGISLTGGLNKWRKYFGEKIVHAKWYETDIKNKLTEIISQIGHFPTCQELKDMHYTGLLTAIENQGGINKLRITMNYPILKKHKRRKLV